MKKVLSMVVALGLVMSMVLTIPVSAYYEVEIPVTTNSNEENYEDWFDDEEYDPGWYDDDENDEWDYEWNEKEGITSEDGNYKYTLEDGKATIIQVDIQNFPKTYTFPSKIDGYTVTTIGEEAMLSAWGMENVIIPDCITTIEDKAFYFTDVQTVTIGKNVQHIGEFAFSFTELNELTVDPANAYFVSIDNVLFTKDVEKLLQFPIDSDTTNYVIPDTVTEIGNGAFFGAFNLEKITLSKNLEKIGERAFESVGISEIKLFSKVKDIASDAFCDMYNLEKFEVVSDNTNYCSKDGVLFSKDMKQLISYPSIKDVSKYTIPDGVEKLCDYSLNSYNLEEAIIPDSVKEYGANLFLNSDNLRSVKLSENAEIISESMFNCCQSLEEIIIPECVIKIDDAAFLDCTSLKTVKMGNKVTAIGDLAFANCAMLKTINIPDTVTFMGNDIFSDCNKVVITCSSKSAAAYYAKSYMLEFEYTDVVLVKSVKLNANTIKWPVGKSGSFKPVILPENAENKTLSWKSSDPTVASIDLNGKLKALKEGTTTITCKTTDGSNLMDTCKVTIGPKVQSVKLNATTLCWPTGKSGTFKPTVSPSDAVIKELSWTSSNTKVATIDQNGKLKAVGEGTAVITCKATDGSDKSATCRITVKNNVASSLKLNATKINWQVGKSGHFKPTVLPASCAKQKLEWASSNPKVATVDANGKLTAVGIGTTTITCKTTDGSNLKATCTVTVGKLVSSLKLNVSSLTWPVGKAGSFKPTVSPSNAANKTLSWTSSNPAVATVSTNGKLTALKEGTTTITCKATDGSGKSATCKVTISNKITTLKLNATSIVWEVGKSGSFKPVVEPEISASKIKWESLNTEVATVSSSGKLTAKAPGTAKIVCKATDGSNKVAYCQVLVTKNGQLPNYTKLFKDYFKDGTYAINGEYEFEMGDLQSTQVEIGITPSQSYRYELDEYTNSKSIKNADGFFMINYKVVLSDLFTEEEAKKYGVPLEYYNVPKTYYYEEVDAYEEQYSFLENLIYEGSESKKINGTTYIVEEFRTGDIDDSTEFCFDKNGNLCYIIFNDCFDSYTLKVTGVKGTFKYSDYKIPTDAILLFAE